MKKVERVVIIGATSKIAQHCARIWAMESPLEIVLVGRDDQKINEIANDLKVRAPNILILCRTLNFLDPMQIQMLVQELTSKKRIDIVLIAQGWLPNQSVCQLDLARNKDALEINAISPVLFGEAFSTAMEKHGGGTIAIIGSVAGDRARKSNYTYGAAKGLVESYAEGLQHRLYKSAVNVVLIKPGPTDTPMTAHLKGGRVRLADANEVAKKIVNGIKKNVSVLYVPRRWFLIMCIIRNIPRKIFMILDI